MVDGSTGLTERRRFSRADLFLVAGIPAAMAFILSIPCVRFPFLWDDIDFLRMAQASPTMLLLPNAQDPFYRPISRGLYFGFFAMLGPDGTILAHLINSLAFAAAATLISLFMARLRGLRSGLLTGMAFATLGAAPFLVAFTSGIQDLAAILFVMLALHQRQADRTALAVVASSCALLSKETSLAAIPVIAFYDYIVGRKPYRFLLNTLTYGGLAFAWALSHPGIRSLLLNVPDHVPIAYLGPVSPSTWLSAAAKYLLTMANVPLTGPATQWPAHLTPYFVAALGVGSFALIASARLNHSTSTAGLNETRREVTLGLLLALPPLLLTLFTLQRWAPYYVALPFVGGAILLGAMLVKIRFPVAAFILLVFLTFGVWLRGMHLRVDFATEETLTRAANTLVRLERDLRALHPSFPHRAQVLLSFQATDSLGVSTELYRSQALKVFYRDDSIETRPPEERSAGDEPEFLIAVGPNHSVIGIDPASLRARSPGAPPDYVTCEAAVRSYAHGLYASGETDRAVQTMLRSPDPTPSLKSFHERIGAIFLLADGRTDEAIGIIRAAPRLDKREGVYRACMLLRSTLPRRITTRMVLNAFEISRTDSSSLRELARCLELGNRPDIASEF